jgi:hypothetical protein
MGKLCTKPTSMTPQLIIIVSFFYNFYPSILIALPVFMAGSELDTGTPGHSLRQRVLPPQHADRQSLASLT